MAGHGPAPAGLATRAGFSATRTSVKRGSPLAASTTGVRTGASRTEEITTTACALASTHDQYLIASPTSIATNTRLKTRRSLLPVSPSAEFLPRNASPTQNDLSCA